jgi:hypothetical protein
MSDKEFDEEFAGRVEHLWLERPTYATAGFELRVLNEINEQTDAVSVSHELAFRNLLELHAIRVILIWTLVLIPALLVTLALVINSLGHQAVPASVP